MRSRRVERGPTGGRRTWLQWTVLAAALTMAGRGSAVVAQPEPGFEPLFDGRSLAGWNGDTQGTWRVEEGAIVAGSDTLASPRN